MTKERITSTETQPMVPLWPNVTVQWLLPGRVILIRAKGEVSLREREGVHSQIIGMIHSCATPSIHLISDTQEMTAIRWSVFNRPSALAAHPRRGWWINIGTVPTVRLKWLARLLGQLSRRRYIYCDSMPEALQTLQRLDPTLPELMVLLQETSQAATL